MFSRYFLSERDLEAIQRALTANPLLASLLMLSPIDAFTYLNLMPRFFDALLPPPAEDALLIQRVVQALAAGQTALDQPQVLQPDVELMVAESAPLAVVEPPAGAEPAGPDIALSVSKATLQRAVGLYADGSFKGQEFAFPVQRWLDVNAIGESIDLNLFQRGARIIARLRGTFVFRSVSARLDLLPRKINFPIEIGLLASLSVDREDRLFLSVSEGEMVILNPPLPSRVAKDVVSKIVNTLPSIPLVQLPTRFEIPGDPAAELLIRLSHIGIDETGLRLEFHLDD